MKSLSANNRRRFPNLPGWMPWMLVLPDLLALAGCLWLSVATNTDVGYMPSLLGFGLFPIAGAVILWKQPRNLVGWLSAGLGFIFVFNELFSLYSNLALILQPGAWPLSGLISWISAWLWQVGYAITIALILVIPSGRPLSGRWGRLIWASLLVVLPVVILNMVLLWPYRGLTLIRAESDINVLPVGAFVSRETLIWQSIIIVFLIVAVIGLFLRFYKARGLERQQLKWIMLACMLVPVSLLIGFLANLLQIPWLQAMNQGINILSIIAFPISFAFAVTRYRLYDIDVIIRRTLVYSTLTIILALVYLGSVLFIQALLTAITRQGSTLGVVLSTLLIAALFAPLRRRIQDIIDRRFFRKRYNADLMLEQFAASTRSELALENMTDELIQVIDETLQPEQISLWLRESPERQQP